jgi:hypothetical protein
MRRTILLAAVVASVTIWTALYTHNRAADVLGVVGVLVCLFAVMAFWDLLQKAWPSRFHLSGIPPDLLGKWLLIAVLLLILELTYTATFWAFL